MGLLRKIIGYALFLAVVVFGLQVVASESGEVVVLRTFADGVAKETRVWIVDDRGTSWLRAGQPTSSWYRRILANPDIEVRRGSETREYRAFPLEGGPAAEHINALMLRKYGWADEVIGFLFDRSSAVAIRLDPR
jgi:hypothetical protein